MDLTECTLCNEQYNDSNRRARNLSCGHYYCQNCLNKIINSATPHCPSCRADISARSAESLPPYFLIDDLISKLKSGTVLVVSKKKVDESDDNFSAGDCPKHKKCQLYFTCRSHKIKICRDCTVIDHNPSRCEIISFEDEIKETKESTISNLKTHKTSREKNIKDLQDIITEKEATIHNHQTEIEKLQKNVNESKQIVNKANLGIQDCKENKRRIETVEQELASSITVKQINQACKQAESVIKSSNSLEKSMETNFNIIGYQDLADQDPVSLIKKVLESNATVHATAEVNGENHYAQLVVKDGHVVLPALASCNSPPAPNKIVTVSSLLSCYTNTDIYLTLSSGGKQLGSVYVKLRDNATANYTRKLCMGTIGPSYRGAKFDHKDYCYFRTEDIRQYDASSCSELPPAESGPKEAKRGMVFMMYKNNLGIYMRGNTPRPAVGDVINGMSVVEEAYTYSQGQVSISDVGIVLK